MEERERKEEKGDDGVLREGEECSERERHTHSLIVLFRLYATTRASSLALC